MGGLVLPSSRAQRFLNRLELGETEVDPLNREVKRISSDTVVLIATGQELSDSQYVEETDAELADDEALNDHPLDQDNHLTDDET
jgi:hypothetical protein